MTEDEAAIGFKRRRAAEREESRAHEESSRRAALATELSAITSWLLYAAGHESIDDPRPVEQAEKRANQIICRLAKELRGAKTRMMTAATVGPLAATWLTPIARREGEARQRETDARSVALATELQALCAYRAIWCDDSRKPPGVMARLHAVAARRDEIVDLMLARAGHR